MKTYRQLFGSQCS